MKNFEETGSMDTAIIPKGTIINGNIDITGKLEMYGEIKGDIKSDSRVNICGTVTGDIHANDLYTKDSFIEGHIDCIQGAVVRENTVILGDINAETLVIDGAIQGKLDVRGGITVGDNAIIDSDIKAKSIQVSDGAALNGHCSLCYADIKVTEFFPETPEVTPAQPETPTEPEKPVADDPAETDGAAEEAGGDKAKAAKPKAVKPKAVKKADAES